MPKASYEQNNEGYRSSSAELGHLGSATAGTGQHAVRQESLDEENRVKGLEFHANPSQKHFSPRRGRLGQMVTLRDVPSQETAITESAAGRLNIQQDQPDNPAF